jgi:glycosyltransferase involved in cell wall biosynthesis
MENEHFGMATAEMTRAGCLVFAHNSGGSPEVLNNEPALLWNDDEEAVRKICDLARRTGEDLHRQRSTLRLHAERFSTDTFQTRIREIVDGLR